MVLLKITASEDKRSRSHIIRSCVIRSCIIQKLHHQKLCYQKLPHQKSFHQKLKINWICKRFKDWRIITAKAVYWIRKHNKRLVEFCNGHFKGVWRHVLAIWTKALTFVRIVQPRSPLLYFVSTLQDKKTAPEYGFACIDVPLDKEWISN